MHDRSHNLVMVNYLSPRDILIVTYMMHGNWQVLFKISLLSSLSLIGYLTHTLYMYNQYFASQSTINENIKLQRLRYLLFITNIHKCVSMNIRHEYIHNL